MQGLIPAVVYGAGQDSVAVTVDPKVITKILYSDSGHNTIFDLAIEGAAASQGHDCRLAERAHQGPSAAHRHQAHRDGQGHACLRPGQSLIGIPAGVKTQGGVLNQVLHEVEIECLPGDIPSHIDVDVSALEINGTVHIKDLPHARR